MLLSTQIEERKASGNHVLYDSSSKRPNRVMVEDDHSLQGAEFGELHAFVMIFRFTCSTHC